MRFSYLASCFLTLLLSGIVACSSNPEARTAREFVEQYSKAWKNGDVDAILAMRLRKPIIDIDLKPHMKKELEEASLADEKDEIGQSIERRDFAYTAWSNTEYVSDQDHQDHIHVSVSVAGAPSSIVLVREEGVLKIHPNPSIFR
jgi:predicted component of type VI protein secretion system